MSEPLADPSVSDAYARGWDDCERVKVVPMHERLRRMHDALSRILPYAESPDFDNGPPEAPGNPYAEAMEKAQRVCREESISLAVDL